MMGAEAGRKDADGTGDNVMGRGEERGALRDLPRQGCGLRGSWLTSTRGGQGSGVRGQGA